MSSYASRSSMKNLIFFLPFFKRFGLYHPFSFIFSFLNNLSPNVCKFKILPIFMKMYGQQLAVNYGSISNLLEKVLLNRPQ